ncbi:MAG: hypothetical protein IPH44_28065 [Myxococcales bacterium]|nr:hypothetical protein [Myxococcales bacterium]
MRPRLDWDRATGRLRARDGAHRVAIASGGTIADRGLYGVYVSGATGPGARVGELDEEMVFESKVGDRFVLGASTWRIDDITHDRVLVSPAPGEPGRMPFWRGESAMRAFELGQRMGALARELAAVPAAAAHDRLVGELALAPAAAEVLVSELAEQARVSAVPTDRTVVVEVSRDDLGDLRVCVLAPFGARVMAPWAMLAQHAARAALGFEVELLWTNDGFVVRLPDGSGLDGGDGWLFPAAATVVDDLTGLCGQTSMFAARFREAAGRALLLPRRRPGQRTPLWHVRKKAQDLLRGAQRVPDFPIVLEAYRKVLTDVLDVAALRAVLGGIADGTIAVERRLVDAPSPAASAVLFGYVASFMYEGDAPPLERRAAALAIDPARLRELIGDVPWRELIDAEVLAELEAALARADDAPTTADGWHDRLRYLGDVARGAPEVDALIAAGRALAVGARGDRVIPISTPAATRPRSAPRSRPAASGVPRRRPRPAPRSDRAAGPDPRPVRAGRPSRALRRGRRRRAGPDPGGAGRDRRAGGRRVPPRRPGRRVDRRRSPAHAAIAIAGAGAPADRAGAGRGVRALPARVARRGPPPARPRRGARRDREAAGPAGAGVGARGRAVAGAGRRLLARRPRHAGRRWRGGVARRGPVGDQDGRIVLALADHAERFADRGLRRALAEAGELDHRILALLAARGALFFTEIRAAIDVPRRSGARALAAHLARAGGQRQLPPLRELGHDQPVAARRGGRGRAAAAAFRSRRAQPTAAEGRWSVVPPPRLDRRRAAHALLQQWLTATAWSPATAPPPRAASARPTRCCARSRTPAGWCAATSPPTSARCSSHGGAV